MQFFESLFGVSPDGGSGSLEALLLMLAVSLAFAFPHRKFLARLLPIAQRWWPSANSRARTGRQSQANSAFVTRSS
jgi:hypothetical protein